MGYTRFTIGLNSNVYKRLKELKRLSGESVSKLIESMIEKEIVKYEEHYKWIDEIRRQTSQSNITLSTCNKPLFRIKYKPNSE